MIKFNLALTLFFLISVKTQAQEITTYTSWQDDYVGWCRYVPEQVLYDQKTNTYRELQEHDSFTKGQLAKIDSMTIDVFKLIIKGNELYTEALEIEMNMYEMKPLIFGIHNKAYTNLNEAIKLNQKAITITEQIHKIKNEIAYESSLLPFTELMEQNIQKYKLALGRLEKFKRQKAIQDQKDRENKE